MTILHDVAWQRGSGRRRYGEQAHRRRVGRWRDRLRCSYHAHRRSTSCVGQIRAEAVAASCHTTETESAPFCARWTVRVFLTAHRGGPTATRKLTSVALHPVRKLRASVSFCHANLGAGDALDAAQVHALEVRRTEVCVRDVRVAQIRLVELRALEVRIVQPRPGEVRPCEICAGEGGP